MSTLSAVEELGRYTDARYARMGRGELMEPDSGLTSRLSNALLERGVEGSELEDLVYETVGCANWRTVNAQEAAAGPVRTRSTAERRAVEVNDRGIEAQVEFLINEMGAEAVLYALRDQLHPSGPSP